MAHYKFNNYFENPESELEAKVNLERAINDLRKFYKGRFYDLIHERGCNKESEEAYSNMQTMEAMHHMKLTLKSNE